MTINRNAACNAVHNVIREHRTMSRHNKLGDVAEAYENARVWRAVNAALDAIEQEPTLTIPDSPKMLRETLCVAQTAVNCPGLMLESERRKHTVRLQQLIDQCDGHRPLGPDGKHGKRHTPTCGCEDKTAGARAERIERGLLAAFDREDTAEFELTETRRKLKMARADWQTLRERLFAALGIDPEFWPLPSVPEMVSRLVQERDEVRAELAAAVQERQQARAFTVEAIVRVAEALGAQIQPPKPEADRG